MKFSIVIPAWNEALWIEKTLAAVIHQSYRNFEVIVVDNNSTDNTVEVVRKFIAKHDTDRKIRILDCPVKGILHARNCGLQAVTGDIVVQLDADNIARPDWLSNAAKHFENKDNVALGGAYDYYDANFLFRYIGFLFEIITLPLANYYAQKRKFGAFMIGGNAFIKKSVLDAMGGYDTTHTFYSEDLVTARAVSKYGWVAFGYDMTIKSSARRHKKLGYMKVQGQYNMGTSAVLRGKPIPNQPEEYNDPR